MRTFQQTLARFLADNRGASAVEFVLTLPIFLAAYALACTLVQAMIVQRDVALTARTVTDLVARQKTSVARSDLMPMLQTASAVMTPWSSANLSIVVSEVQIQADGSGVVVWSEPAFKGVKRKKGSVVPNPGVNFAQGSYQVLGEVSYLYTPFDGFATGAAPFSLSYANYNAPRYTLSISETFP